MTNVTGSLWKNQDFLKFWAGQTISVFGSAITALALPLTAVSTLNVTAAQMGLLNAAETLPFLLVGLFAGVWIDRSRRRPIMLAADLGRALLLGLIPLAMAFHFLRVELLYGIAFLVGIMSVFFDVSYQAFVPALVSRNRLVEGNSKLEVSFSAAAIAGPGLAGALIQLLTAPFAIAFDAVSFVVSAISLAWIRTPEPAPAVREGGRNMRKEIAEGLHVIFGNRLLWSIAGSTGTSNFFSSMWGAMYVLYMTRILGLTPALIGLVFAAGAPGALVGALVSDRVAKRFGLGRVIVFAMLWCGVFPLLILLVRGSDFLSLGLMMLAGFGSGFGGMIYNINQVSLRQAITPDHLLGRMNASMRFLVWGTLPLGALAASGLSVVLGVSATLTVGVLGGLLAFLWTYLSPVRHLQKQPEFSEE